MRKRVVFAIFMLLGMVLLVAVADSNWFLAAIMGVLIGASLATSMFAYPLDAAPPADRRHEADQRRRRERALKGYGESNCR
jgi:hypothetical protein